MRVTDPDSELQPVRTGNKTHSVPFCCHLLMKKCFSAEIKKKINVGFAEFDSVSMLCTRLQYSCGVVVTSEAWMELWFVPPQRTMISPRMLIAAENGSNGTC